MKLKSLKTLEYALNGSFLSTYILDTSGFLNIGTRIYFLKIAVLFLFLYEVEPKMLKRVDRSKNRKESFFEKNKIFKIIIVILSFIYLWLLSEIFEGKFCIFIAYILRHYITFNLLQSWIIFITILLASGFLIGIYILNHGQKRGNILKRIYQNLFSSLHKEEVESDIQKFEKTINLEKTSFYYKFHFWAFVIGIGAVISFISALFSIVLLISVEAPLFLVFLILTWLVYDIIENEITGTFSLKELVERGKKKSEHTKKLFFNFEILNYGQKGIFVVLFIFIGLMITIVYGSQAVVFLFFDSNLLSVVTQVGLTEIYIRGEFFLLTWFFLTLIPFLGVAILLMVWYSIIKRLPLWIENPWSRSCESKMARCLPKYPLISAFFSIFSFSFTMNLGLYITEKADQGVITEEHAIVFLCLSFFIGVVILFSLCRSSLKRVKSKKVVEIKSLKKDNYRIMALVVILNIGWIPVTYLEGGYGISSSDIEHTVVWLLFLGLSSLVYLSSEIEVAIRNKIGNKIHKSLLSNIFYTFMVFYAILILRYFVYFNYIYLLIIPFALIPLYLASYLDIVYK